MVIFIFTIDHVIIRNVGVLQSGDKAGFACIQKTFKSPLQRKGHVKNDEFLLKQENGLLIRPQALAPKREI